MRIVELDLSALDERYGRLRVADRRRLARMLASIEEYGQQDAIRVVAEGEGRFAVIDGHARVAALRRLRRDMVRAVVLEAGPAEALAAAYREGQARGYNAIEEGWLVYELHRVWKWDLEKVSAAMGRSRGWASRRLGLVEALPDAVLEGVQCGRLGAWSAMKHLLPLARANGPACERLAAKVMEASLSSREVGLVCEYWVKSGAEVGDRILEDPARFLKALESTRHKDAGSLSPEELRCLKNLELIGNVSLGLARNLPAVVGNETAQGARERLKPAWERARRRWDELSKTVAAVLVAAARPASCGTDRRNEGVLAHAG